MNRWNNITTHTYNEIIILGREEMETQTSSNMFIKKIIIM